jgi:Ca2+-binding RTX toxin-like protein
VWGGPGIDDIDAGSGDDMVRAGIHNDIVRGGDGNDELRGGAQNDVLLGGAGNDLVHGANDRDLVIGGWGDDRVEGMVGEDLLIGSYTIYDDNDDDLLAILAEWSNGEKGPDWIDERIANLENGTGDADGRRINAATVLDDQEHDLLWGFYSSDWFLVFDGDEFNEEDPNDPHPTKDRITEL